MAKRPPKPGNGEGESGLISVVFDLGDPVEAEAYRMAKQLAKPHGRRKQVIVALLYGLSQYQKYNGEIINTDSEAIEALAANMMSGAKTAPLNIPPRPATLEEPTITVSSAHKASAQEVAENFLKSMGSLFD
jgi:hypothetical protein